MKTIEELRHGFRFPVQKGICFRLKYLTANRKIDFDVYLPSKNKNLQRELVWGILQKQELIWSVLVGRNVPSISVIDRYDSSWEVIDGKQRLSTLLEFIDGRFPITIEGSTALWFFNHLPKDYQQVLVNYDIRADIAYEMEIPITDNQKIEWFKMINFSGTPQDKEHLQSLSK